MLFAKLQMVKSTDSITTGQLLAHKLLKAWSRAAKQTPKNLSEQFKLQQAAYITLADVVAWDIGSDPM